MNGYTCMWNGQKVEVYADTAFQARQKAMELFKRSPRVKIKPWEITTTLCEKDGEQVVHKPMM